MAIRKIPVGSATCTDLAAVDTKIDGIVTETAGLNGDAMRGTNSAAIAAVGQRHIFNRGTRISGSAKNVSGTDNVGVILEVMQI